MSWTPILLLARLSFVESLLTICPIMELYFVIFSNQWFYDIDDIIDDVSLGFANSADD
jgi:hypothetical protein